MKPKGEPKLTGLKGKWFSVYLKAPSGSTSCVRSRKKKKHPKSVSEKQGVARQNERTGDWSWLPGAGGVEWSEAAGARWREMSFPFTPKLLERVEMDGRPKSAKDKFSRLKDYLQWHVFAPSATFHCAWEFGIPASGFFCFYFDAQSLFVCWLLPVRRCGNEMDALCVCFSVCAPPTAVGMGTVDRIFQRNIK